MSRKILLDRMAVEYGEFQRLQSLESGSERTLNLLERLEFTRVELVDCVTKPLPFRGSYDIHHLAPLSFGAYDQYMLGKPALLDRQVLQAAVCEELMIDSLLDGLIDEIDRVLNLDSVSELCAEMDICFQVVDEVILPPDDLEFQMGGGEDAETYEGLETFSQIEVVIGAFERL